MKRLLLVAEHPDVVRDWCLQVGVPPHYHRMVSPHDNPNKWRGYTEHNIAIVWLEAIVLPKEHQVVLDIYATLGAPEFHRNAHKEILEWLAS